MEMPEDIDAQTKLKLYLLMVSRYKDLISEKESHSVSEIRQRVSPYGESVKKISRRLLPKPDFYIYERDFFAAAQKAISYIRDIKTVEFSITFWMEFTEIDELRIAGVMDKALLLAALLRSFGSQDTLVKVTKSENPYVSFSCEGQEYLFVPGSGSLLAGDDAVAIFKKDPLAYSFNDLVYENFEED